MPDCRLGAYAAHILIQLSQVIVDRTNASFIPSLFEFLEDPRAVEFIRCTSPFKDLILVRIDLGMSHRPVIDRFMIHLQQGSYGIPRNPEGFCSRTFGLGLSVNHLDCRPIFHLLHLFSSSFPQ